MMTTSHPPDEDNLSPVRPSEIAAGARHIIRYRSTLQRYWGSEPLFALRMPSQRAAGRRVAKATPMRSLLKAFYKGLD